MHLEARMEEQERVVKKGRIEDICENCNGKHMQNGKEMSADIILSSDFSNVLSKFSHAHKAAAHLLQK